MLSKCQVWVEHPKGFGTTQSYVDCDVYCKSRGEFCIGGIINWKNNSLGGERTKSLFLQCKKNYPWADIIDVDLF